MHMSLPATEGMLSVPWFFLSLFAQSSRTVIADTLPAAIYAQARALLDWNARNPFCAQCGQPTLSINAGTKRACPPADMASFPHP
jgi:NAD+ diphosphatase